MADAEIKQTNGNGKHALEESESSPVKTKMLKSESGEQLKNGICKGDAVVVDTTTPSEEGSHQSGIVADVDESNTNTLGDVESCEEAGDVVVGSTTNGDEVEAILKGSGKVQNGKFDQDEDDDDDDDDDCDEDDDDDLGDDDEEDDEEDELEDDEEDACELDDDEPDEEN